MRGLKMAVCEFRRGPLKWIVLIVLIMIFVVPFWGFEKAEESEYYKYKLFGMKSGRFDVGTVKGKSFSYEELGDLYPVICINMLCSFFVLVLFSWISARLFMTLVAPGSGEFLLTRGAGRLSLMGTRFGVALAGVLVFAMVCGLAAVAGTGFALGEWSGAFFLSIPIVLVIYLAVVGLTLLLVVAWRSVGLAVGVSAAVIVASLIFDGAYLVMQRILSSQQDTLAYKIIAVIHAVLPNIMNLGTASLTYPAGAPFPTFEAVTTIIFGVATAAGGLAIFAFRDL